MPVMNRFTLKIARNQVISNVFFRKVELPQVAKMTFNISRNPKPTYSGIRRFNRELSPALRYHNDHVEFIVNNPVNNNTNTPSVDVTFVDGTTANYDALDKDSVTIFNDLISVAKGISHIPQRKLAEPELGEAIYTQPTKAN